MTETRKVTPFPKRPATGSGDVGRSGSGGKPVREKVFFNRHELGRILSVYGTMVAAGEWRDYAIDDGPDAVVFSVYRRSSEMPLYRIEKRPKLAQRQGAYSIIAASGQILKRGQELDQVLKFFNRKKFRLISH